MSPSRCKRAPAGDPSKLRTWVPRLPSEMQWLKPFKRRSANELLRFMTARLPTRARAMLQSPAAGSPPPAQAGRLRLQLGRVHRLDQVVVEARLPRPPAVRLLAPPRQGRDRPAGEGWHLPQPTGHLVAV